MNTYRSSMNIDNTTVDKYNIATENRNSTMIKLRFTTANLCNCRASSHWQSVHKTLL